jgi:fructosamine-3-kinase
MEDILEHLSRIVGQSAKMGSLRTLSGGCIHAVYSCEFQKDKLFIKTSQSLDLLEAEADGLMALREQTHKAKEKPHFKIPEVVACEELGGRAFLALEYLELGHRGSAEDMGRALAQLHKQRTGPFGWHRHNYLGATFQAEGIADDWCDYFSRYRLGPMLSLMDSKGYALAEGSALLEKLPLFFEGYTAKPSLLHGDLWGGNVGFVADGSPTCYDPAVLVGDREFDLAMTELFGGFSNVFYGAYKEIMPLDQAYPLRRELYQFYHIANHVVLFGDSYVGQAQSMAQSLIKKA